MEQEKFIGIMEDASEMRNFLSDNDFSGALSEVASFSNITPERMYGLPTDLKTRAGRPMIYGETLTELQNNINRYIAVFDMTSDSNSHRFLTRSMAYRLYPSPSVFENMYIDSDDTAALNTAIDGNPHALIISGDKRAAEEIIAAKAQIAENSPNIRIDTSAVSDLWEIPHLISDISQDYSFKLRKRGAADAVIFAYLKENLIKATGSTAVPKRIAAISPDDGWTNAQLLKDCGVIPYLLHKNHGHEVTLIGGDKGPYPNLEKYLDGLKIQFLIDNNIENNYDLIIEKILYIQENAKDLDALVLYGCYPVYWPLVKRYKELNPNGKVYIGLDVNSGWMDRIDPANPELTELLYACDVIGAFGYGLTDYLNSKWKYKIHRIPHGYYNFAPNFRPPVFSEKEDTIITVARLGDAAKDTHLLMEAFAKIADKIPGWTLRLVGNVEPKFEPFIKKYFEKFPELKDRVIFTGLIADKDALMAEYRRAKIFALTSVVEGGLPNVIAEAFAGGCAIATTEVDSYGDAICQGECGLSSKIGDIDGFADILLKLATQRDLEKMSERAYLASQTDFNYSHIVARINEMLFKGGNNGGH